MKDKEYHVANFATFVSKLLLFPPQKWMNLISDRLSTASIKYLNWPSPVFGWFQNGCNKVVIEPRVMQFWSEIILVISNWTCTTRLFYLEIMRMISAQIALHSVQLPSLITIDFKLDVIYQEERKRIQHDSIISHLSWTILSAYGRHPLHL